MDARRQEDVKARYMQLDRLHNTEEPPTARDTMNVAAFDEFPLSMHRLLGSLSMLVVHAYERPAR